MQPVPVQYAPRNADYVYPDLFMLHSLDKLDTAPLIEKRTHIVSPATALYGLHFEIENID